MGLLAQEVLHHKPEAVGKDQGYLTVDYRKATEDAVPHRAAGGLVPRQGYQTAGTVPAAADDATAAPGPKDVYNHLISQGADPNTALMLTGAAASESNFNPTAPHDYDKNGIPAGYGMFGHQGPRLDAMRQMTGAEKPNWKQQATFALTEAQDPRYRDMLANAKTPEDIARVQMHFERPKGYTPENPEAGHNYAGRVAHIAAFQPLTSGQDVNWPTGAPKQQPQQSYPFQQQIEGGLGKAKSMVDSFAPTDVRGQDRTMGQFLTSKDFVIPLLTGLGTMASSPSRYLGAAILQGLGGAAQAYQGVQKQQADIQGTQAGTEAVLSNISKGAAVYGPSGQLTGYRVYINGKVTQVPATEFMRAMRAGTPYQTAPDVGGMGGGPPAPAPEKKPTETGGLAGGAPSPTGATAGPETSTAPAPTPYRALTAEDQKLVEKNAEGIMTSNPSAVGKDATAYADAASGASNSMINRPRSLSYAKSLSELPAKGPISSNAFSAEVTTPFIEYVNGLIHSIPGGGDINIARPEDLANVETLRKISGLQATAQATQAGQHSWSALQSALATTPTQRNTPMGAANLMSDILMQEQLPIDYYSHLDIMKNYAQQKGLVTGEDQAKMLGTGTFKNFMDRYSQQQMQEKESLKQIFLTPLEYKDANGQPVKTSLMSYMISHGGQVPEALRPEIEKRYGTEIYRYFNTAGKAR
jgi:hypothetical protein